MGISFNQTLWYVRQLLKGLGLWGILGCLIIFTTGILFNSAYFASVSRLQQQDQQEFTELLTSPADLATTAPSNQAREDESSLNDLSSLLTLLPDEHRLPSILNQIHQNAKLAQLSILTAEYKWRKIKNTTTFIDGSLVQYEITFPVKGSYTAIRNMLNAVLAQIPTLALDSLELKRENVTSTLTEARVTFVVFLLDGN